jgi:hypothetical protein
MSADAITVRALETAAERDGFFRLATQAFIPSEDPEREATG